METNTIAQVDVQQVSSLRAGEAGGPRRSQGKERSKHNALKHGIFSNVVLLGFESRSQFDALLRGLRLDLAPEGMLEGILVEKLATILWRHRRLLQTESAAVQSNIQHEEAEKASRSDQRLDLESDVERLRAQHDTTSLIHGIDDPHVLECCMDRLLGVRMELQTIGLDHETHSILLARVYGARSKDRINNDLLDFYLKCRNAERASVEERRKTGFLSVEDCLRKFQDELAKEIQRLERLRKQPISDQPSSDQSDAELRLSERELWGAQSLIARRWIVFSVTRQASSERLIERWASSSAFRRFAAVSRWYPQWMFASLRDEVRSEAGRHSG